MTKTINKIPAKTWNWLKMNEVHLDVPDGLDSSEEIKIHATSGGEKASELPFEFENGAKTEGNINISVDSDINHTVVMDFKSDNGGYSDVSVKIALEKNAKLTLVQVHRLGDDFTFTGRIDADVDEKAEFHLMHVFIRGGQIYQDVYSNLKAKKSALKIDTGYLTTQKEILDINYEASHLGEQSMSDISVRGALCDEATKRFRGTIDFKLGAIGAKGNEIEEVLMLDENVVNQTIPIILCEEEDVEGNHGASIGRLDDDTLYYMMSRGMDETSIREMMKRAYVDAVLRSVPEEAKEMVDRIRNEEGLEEN